MDTRKMGAQNEQNNEMINRTPKYTCLFNLVRTDRKTMQALDNWRKNAALYYVDYGTDGFSDVLKRDAFDIGELIVHRSGHRICEFDKYFEYSNGQKYLQDLFNNYKIMRINRQHRKIGWDGFIEQINGNVSMRAASEEVLNRFNTQYLLSDEEFKEFIKCCIAILQGEKPVIDMDHVSKPMSNAIKKFSDEFKLIKNCNINSDPIFIDRALTFNSTTISVFSIAMEFCIQYYLQCLQNKAILDAWKFIGKLNMSRNISNQ